MKYLAIKNSDTNKLAAVIGSLNGKIYFVTSTKIQSVIFGTILKKPSIYIEVRKDAKTILKEEIRREDEKYLDALKTKITVPYIVYTNGMVPKMGSPNESINKVWNLFSPEEHQEMMEV